MDGFSTTKFALLRMICGKTADLVAKKRRLVKYVRMNDLKRLESLLLYDSSLLSEPYGPPYNKNIVLIACDDSNGMERVSASTVETLVRLGGDLCEPSDNDQWEAIHYAALNSNREKLGTILKFLNELEANSLVYCSIHLQPAYCEKRIPKSYSNNALHVLLKYGKRTENFHDCFALLVEKGVDLMQQDSNGLTPQDLVKQFGDEYLNEIVQKYSTPANTDYFRKIKRHFCLSYHSKEDEILSNGINPGDEHICDGVSEGTSSCTFLQLSCAKGMEKCVKMLLDAGASPNDTIKKNPNSPILVAIKNDKYEIVKLLLSCSKIILPENLLVQLQTRYKKPKNFDKIGKYEELLFGYLRDRPKLCRRLLNATDELGRTSLHYATYYGNAPNVLGLLQMGAPLTPRDIFGMTPLDHIEPMVLEKFLDNCVKIPSDDDDLNNFLYSLKNEKHHFSIEIDYTNLIAADEEEAPESEFLQHIIKVKRLKRLVNHPVIACYLALKWQQFRYVDFLNLCLYVFSYITLVFYGFQYYQLKTFSNSFLLISLVLTVTRELFQLFVFRWYYFKTYQSYIDIALIGGVIYIVAAGWFDYLQNQNLLVSFSVVFLMSTLGIFMQIGNFPMFTIKVMIFRRITITFLKYMLFYMFPVLAFAVCFYMLAEEKQGMFLDRIYESIVMFAGDPDSSYPEQFATNPIFGHIIYVVFVIVIGIILQNLLVGLAVSDLQEIRSEAEFYDKKERAEYITNIEQNLLQKQRASSNFLSRKIFTYLVDAAKMFKEERILVVQPFNNGRVGTKDDPRMNRSINDENVMKYLQDTFKAVILDDNRDAEENGYSLKSLHRRLENIEKILSEMHAERQSDLSTSYL